MAPTRTSRRAAHAQAPQPPQPPPPPVPEQQPEDANINTELFLDPMLGQPLNLYIEKDVEDKEELTQLIIKHGGTVSPGYSGLNYILVDPYKPSGQNLYRQYANKKGKVVLAARWVHECIKSNQLHTFRTNWAGCKVTGNEQAPAPGAESSSRSMQPVAPLPPPPIQASIPHVAPMHPYQFVYTNGMPASRAVPGAPPPQPWVATMAPPQGHLQPPPPHPPGPATDLVHRPPPGSAGYREEGWEGYTPPEEIPGQPAPYDYRYRADQNWVPHPGPYYDTTNVNYEHAYHQPPYMEEAVNQSSTATTAAIPVDGSAPAEREDRPRGRKRTRTQPPPAAPATSLVVNRNPPARSPTPPTRVIKSTYGGNLFTADDVIYLKRYIDYCQEQCLVLSLREICERIAVKAPHHTFYSWRRYCNKHQIRLSGYTMNHDRSESPGGVDDDVNMEVEEAAPQPSASTSNVPREPPAPHLRLDLAAATAAAAASPARNRSPTPPRALFRSTTGKGVAFTQEDVTFLIRFMEYRRSQGALDMIAFWKEVAIKAPHHSRASWMKFWRRHKHELERQEGDEPLPQPPDKKMRYSKSDDILLAKFFYNKPEGTSDKIFQHFGRLNPHHPWKGWQEHHRIHKARIEHLISELNAGQNIDLLEGDNS